MASALKIGLLSSKASLIISDYFAERVYCQDHNVGVSFGIVDYIQVIQLLELQVRSFHVLNDLSLHKPTGVKNIETSSPHVIADMIVFIAFFFSLTLEPIRAAVRF
jgi:hypothetical protein